MDLGIYVKMKEGIQLLVLIQSAEQHDTIMRGVLLLLAVPLVVI